MKYFMIANGVPKCDITKFLFQNFHDYILVEHDEKPLTDQILHESVHGGLRYDYMNT